jgi:hypothetical protein
MPRLGFEPIMPVLVAVTDSTHIRPLMLLIIILKIIIIIIIITTQFRFNKNLLFETTGGTKLYYVCIGMSIK